MIRTGLRALLWLAASAGLLLAGFALFGILVLIPTLVARGGLPTARGWSNLAEFYQGCAMALALATYTDK
jgi:hypothetical protein